MKYLSKYLDSINYLFLFAIACIFILVFSDVASPLTIGYSADSSIFMAMGKMFLNGKIPYVEFFDHKGPSIILLQSMGQIFMPYRSGIFILEIVNLFLVLFFVYKTARLLISRKLSLAVCLFFLVFISRLFNMGNTTEELSLFPLFLTLYYTSKLILKKEIITAGIAFKIGLCFSFLFWLRINNAGAIVASCIFFFFLYILNKDYKSLATLVLYFIIGQLPFTVLYCTYFWYHDGLYELMYATFLFNFMYVESLFNFQTQYTWINYAMLLLLIGGSIVYYIKERDYKIFIFCAILFIITLLSTNIGPAYNHYFILASPAIVLGLILSFFLLTNDKLQIFILLVSLSFFSYTSYKGYKHLSVVTPKAYEDYTESYDNLKYLLDKVPEEEKNRIYLYEVVTSVYPLLGIDTNYKYFIFQEWHGEIDPNVFHEIKEMMLSESSRPLWVVLQRYGELEQNIDRYENTDFVNIINADYELYDNKGVYILYKLK